MLVEGGDALAHTPVSGQEGPRGSPGRSRGRMEVESPRRSAPSNSACRLSPPLPPDCEPARPARSLQCPGGGSDGLLCLTHQCLRPLGPSASCSLESYASRTVLMAKAKRYEGLSDPCVQSSDLRTPRLAPIRPWVARRCHRGISADAGSEAVGATRAAPLARGRPCCLGIGRAAPRNRTHRGCKHTRVCMGKSGLM